MTRPKTAKPEESKNGTAPSMSAMEDAVKSLFRQADKKRDKRLGRPFKDRYSAEGGPGRTRTCI